MGYILCQVPRAKNPYYIENISTNIYSIEELCYYMYHNIYLLDESIMNESLCLWIRDELGLEKLCQKLLSLTGDNMDVGEFILPIFKEINYLTYTEFKEISKKLKTLEEQPEGVRMKQKGDYLFSHEKYINAIRVYMQALQKTKSDNLGVQYKGSIYNNMGCTYARLFQTAEAFECFEHAYDILHSGRALKSYLLSAYFNKGKELYEQLCEKEGVDQKTKHMMDAQIKKAQDVVLPKNIDPLLDNWALSYHRSTDL
ncbi:hypothetical protein INP51_13455 [Blautia liquoris]|uniref:Tetratricopeptide repeat protein n=1 Tax=Blautia liquoris TaxID=2779518 RepID=A0A7M2RFQ1_9FIRM|nr:hypothetical protein [Blautia liquoris]QOV18968.1 hypothetical protein INP51_13455 [Blautia liquoris]